MEVAGDQLGLEAVKPAEIVDGALEGAARLERVQVADVLADDDLTAARDGDGVLEMAAHGEHGGQFPAHADRQRRVAARPPHDALAAARDAHDGVVGRTRDRAVVSEKDVGQ